MVLRPATDRLEVRAMSKTGCLPILPDLLVVGGDFGGKRSQQGSLFGSNMHM